MVVYTKISPNKTSPRNHKIDKITIHHMAGDLSVETCGNVFAPKSRKASSNYGIGSDGRVGMYVEEKDRSWCSSNSSNDHRAITIEVADDTNKAPWHSSQKAMSSLILLCADICRRNGISSLNFTGDKNGNLTLHKYFANTTCPAEYLESRMPKIASEVNRLLQTGETSYVWTEGTETHSESTQTCPVSSTLKKGVKCDEVKELQKNLNMIMNAGLVVDGSFGGKTEKAVKDFQAKYGLEVDGSFGKKSRLKMEQVLASESSTFPYLVKVTANVLNVRKEPTTNSRIVTTIKNGGVYTIVAEDNGWGKLKSGVGWISLKYVNRL